MGCSIAPLLPAPERPRQDAARRDSRLPAEGRPARQDPAPPDGGWAGPRSTPHGAQSPPRAAGAYEVFVATLDGKRERGRHERAGGCRSLLDLAGSCRTVREAYRALPDLAGARNRRVGRRQAQRLYSADCPRWAHITCLAT
jgi:hypothetical protein